MNYLKCKVCCSCFSDFIDLRILCSVGFIDSICLPVYKVRLNLRKMRWIYYLKFWLDVSRNRISFKSTLWRMQKKSRTLGKITTRTRQTGWVFFLCVSEKCVLTKVLLTIIIDKAFELNLSGNSKNNRSYLDKNSVIGISSRNSTSKARVDKPFLGFY